jgi:hypothetical protein
MSSWVLYYNHCVFESAEDKLGTNMNTNAVRTLLLELVYSSFRSIVFLFHDIKSQKNIKLF